MSNLKRLNLENYPSFITTKTINNYPFFSNTVNAEILISTLYFGKQNDWFSLVAFVIMPDHLHLIIIPREKNISQAMHSIKSFSSKAINKIKKRDGKVWQASFRDFTIYTKELLLEKLTYIHENPVRKGIVLEACSYNFSSANPIYETDISIVL
jgi:putative transposase